MKCSIHYRQQCRLCGSEDMRRFLHFDDIPFADEFIKPDALGSEFIAPMDVYWCGNCHSVQTQHDVEISEYYHDYHYTVSNSPFALRFMEKLAQETFTRYQLKEGASVIEIGSSDGYQLLYFKQLGARVLGYEPSEGLTQIANDLGAPTLSVLFSAETTQEIPQEMQPVDVVLLTHTFDHLLDPKPFLGAVRDVIDPQEGLLIIEVHNLAQIMERMETFLFTHEHATYLSALTMKRLLEREGFKLLSVDLIPPEERRVNSLLVVAAHSESTRQPDPDMTFDELTYLDDWNTYVDFEQRVTASYARLKNYVQSLKAQGKRIAGYGSGGRGVMSLALANLTPEEITYVCDRNTNAHGLYTPRTHIPIQPPSYLETDPVDEIIVFSFGYFDEIKQQISGFIGPDVKLTSLLDILNPEHDLTT